VPDADKELISRSVLYVSLEPCAHFGKTPPCADLITRYKIPTCVIGCRDPFKEVDGKGIEKLVAAGVKVETGVLESECKELNKRFFTFHTKHRPYIILKWAQTADGFMAASPQTPVQRSGVYDNSDATKNIHHRLLISNEYSNRLVHRWRSEEAAILVGTTTALLDDPELTTRLWPGPSPVRLVVDRNLSLPSSLKIFDKKNPTVIFNTVQHDENSDPRYYQVTHSDNLVHQVCHALYRMNIQSVLVEGGAGLLQSFIDEGMWDEARIITNTKMTISNGLPAPRLVNAALSGEMVLQHDRIETYKQNQK
jgi:diaminohydroxyphosphoribosylaminopyrimidine deaminase/5-amino-6-(5-phosphoribosylamino)uracil reductase